MIAALRVTWRSLVDLNDEASSLIKGNLVWFLLTLPLGLVVLVALVAFWSLVAGGASDAEALPLLVPIAAALLLLLPTPGAAGLHSLAAVVEEGETPPFAVFWQGLRRYWRSGLALFGIGLLAALVLAYNAWFYPAVLGGPLAYLAILWLYALLFWLAIQLYLFPLLLYVRDKRLSNVYRRAALLALGNPVYTLALLVVSLLFVLLSLVALLLYPLGSMGFLALLGARALGALRERYGEKRLEVDE